MARPRQALGISQDCDESTPLPLLATPRQLIMLADGKQITWALSPRSLITAFLLFSLLAINAPVTATADPSSLSINSYRRIDDILLAQRNLTTRAGSVGTGQPCTSSSDCSNSGFCYGNVCWPGRAQPTQGCSADSQCNSEKCNLANQQCMASDIGFGCRDTDQCQTGECRGLICNLRQTGAACAQDGTCVNGVCDVPSNQCVLKPLGASCSLGSECDSTACTGGVCALIDLGASCGYNSQCKSNWCLYVPDNTGYPVKRCTTASTNQPCRSNTDCGSGVCGNIGANGFGACVASPAKSQCRVQVDCADNAPCSNGRCLSTADASCSSGADCASGTCTSGVCTKIVNGQGCGQDSQCRSAKCGSSQATECGPLGRGPCQLYPVCGINSAYGAPCTTTSDCGAQNTVCTIPTGAQSGTCIYPPPSKNIGDSCSKDFECFSSRCDAASFSEALTCRKTPGGQPCSANSECITNLCVIAAGSTQGKCAVNADGAACETGLDCTSAFCSSGGVCGGSAGSTCTDNGQCSSGICCQGQCLKSQIQYRCQSDAQCNGGVCNLASGNQLSTLTHIYPIGGCSLQAPDSEVCTYARACSSNVCTPVGYYSGGSPVGQCGTLDPSTAPTYTCANQPRRAGEVCNYPYQCLSGSCSSYTPSGGYGYGRRDILSADPEQQQKRGYGDPGVCKPSDVGKSCLSNTDCASGGSCDFATKKCKALLPSGSACSQSAQCASGFCNPASSTCTRNSPLGSACDTTTDCAAGTCYQSVCSILPLGAPCSSADQCSSKYCQYGPPDAGASATQICSAAPPFATCTLSSECGSGKCSNSADTSQPGRCLSSSAGQACTVAMDCDGFTSCVNGKCLARAKTVCTQGSDCQSGTCSAGQCTPAGPNSGCISAMDCASNQCGTTTTTICGANGQGPCSTYTTCNPVSAMGGVCSVDGDCTSVGGICAKFGSANPGTCTIKKPWPNSYTCGQASDCQSGYCRAQLAADGVTRESTGTCSDKRGLGEGCYTNAGCSTGLICSNKSGTCISSVTSTSTTTSTSRSTSSTTTTSRSSTSTSSTTSRSSTSTTSTSTRPTTTTTSSTSTRPTSTLTSTSSRNSSTTTTTSTRSTSTSTSTRSSTTTSSSRSTSTSTTTTRPPTTSTTSTRTTTSTSATPLPSAAACSTSTQCRSAYCRKRLLADGVTRETTGTCEDKKANGAACYTSDGCISTQCNLSTKLCVGLAANAPCASNAQCISSYCRQRLLADGTRDPNGTCDVQKARGSACYQNGGCTSGSCNLSTKVCN
ncbi:hypothetical protein V8E36_002817 [Tilletia maclaganii]